MRPPGVYPPQSDTWLLLRALHSARLPANARVLDLGTGTGAVAVAAALRAEAEVTAIDVSWRAVLTARINAWLSGNRIRVLRGDLFAPVAGERFEVILANPPYVPSPERTVPARGKERAWNAGTHGRLLLDRICALAPRMLARDGTLLIVHSALCGERATLDDLRRGGLAAKVVARQRAPFGPVMHARASWLEEQGLIRRGQRDEELVVIRADRIR
jgi:release factor glutamine methyltransferase